MAEHDHDQRTERATPKRVDEARRRGQVPRSRDLNSAVILLAAGLGLHSLGAALGGDLLALMRDALTLSRAEALGDGQLTVALANAAWQGGKACAPLFGLLFAAAMLAPMLIGGWNLSFDALAPQWDRLDPIAGLRRVFSVTGLLEVGKATARFAVVACVGLLVLWHQSGQLLGLGREPLGAAIAHALDLAGTALIALAGSLVAIAVVDVPLTLWQHQRALRMTRDELREENKETEGNPEIRGAIRSRQQALARRRMMQEVPKADVVVTNPTHYAVALRYDESRMRAPVVVAKGADLVAARIREVAAESGVPILEAPPLARALHRHCDLGDEIPARLYAAVAQVLTHVYQLRTARRTGATPPPAPQIALDAE